MNGVVPVLHLGKCQWIRIQLSIAEINYIANGPEPN